MSKAAEESRGVTTRQQQQQQQAPELCNCGYAQRAKSERPFTATTGRRSSLDSQRGGGLLQPNSASGASTSRAATASYSPSLHGGRSSRDTGKNGDVKTPAVYSSPLLQGERKLRAKTGDSQPPKSPFHLGTASPSSQYVRSLRDNRRYGDEQQQAKSPAVDASPSLQWENSLRDSHRSGGGQQVQGSSGNASPCHQGERSLRGSRSLDAQKAKSPSVDASPSSQDGKSLRDSQRSGDVQQPKSSSGNASPSFQDGKSLRSSSRSLDVQKAKSASVDASSPSLQDGKSLRNSIRSGEGQQSSDSRRSGDVQLLNSCSAHALPSSQAEGSLRDSGRIGDEQQQARSHSLDVSPSLHRPRGLSDSLRNGDVPVLKYPSVSLSDSLRNGDVPLLKYPSVASCSRATPSPTSPSILGWGSLGENGNSGGTHTNSAPFVSPSRSAPTAPSSTCSSLKSKLEAGQKLYGAFLVSFSTVVAEILGWAGYDFVVVDLEQLFPGDILAALPVLQALASTGTPAIFRVPADDPVLVNKALDMGPAGLMFSMIENEEGARNAVASCRYPPRGTRRGSRHVVSRASRYGLDASYMDRCEEELLVICQVEITEALDHIMDIAGVEGVDCIQMGGLDFGASLGDPYFDYNKEKVLARQESVLLAGFATPESSPDVLFKRGYHLVSGALDVVLLRNAALADLQRNKPSLKA